MTDRPARLVVPLSCAARFGARPPVPEKSVWASVGLMVPEEVMGMLPLRASCLNWSMRKDMPLSAAAYARIERSLAADNSRVDEVNIVIEAASAPNSVTYMRATSRADPRRRRLPSRDLGRPADSFIFRTM